MSSAQNISRATPHFMLRPEHADHLAQFHIPSKMLEAAGVRSVTDAEARDALGLSGVLFPYYSPVTGEQRGGCIRLGRQLSGSGKYVSEPGCRHLYFPPDVAHLLHDLTVSVVIVEAEKSALALTALAARSDIGQAFLILSRANPRLPVDPRAASGDWRV